jgi:hypothetical protein
VWETSVVTQLLKTQHPGCCARLLLMKATDAASVTRRSGSANAALHDDDGATGGHDLLVRRERERDTDTTRRDTTTSWSATPSGRNANHSRHMRIQDLPALAISFCPNSPSTLSWPPTLRNDTRILDKTRQWI